MPNQADPLLAPEARADLHRFSRLMQAMLQAWTRRIIHGQVDPDTVHDVVGSTRDPPWKWSEFAGVAVLFRFLTDAELREFGLIAEQILVARIVETAYIAQVAAELLAAEAEEAEEAEKSEPPAL